MSGRKGKPKAAPVKVDIESSYDEDSVMDDAGGAGPAPGFGTNEYHLSFPLYRDTNIRERTIGLLATADNYLACDENLRAVVRYFTFLDWALQDSGEEDPYKIDAVRKVSNAVLALGERLGKKKAFKFELEKPWTPYVKK
jgi:hypothetical protein